MPPFKEMEKEKKKKVHGATRTPINQIATQCDRQHPLIPHNDDQQAWASPLVLRKCINFGG